MRRMMAAGMELKPFSREILEASFKASQQVYAELSEKSPHFKFFSYAALAPLSHKTVK